MARVTFEETDLNILLNALRWDLGRLPTNHIRCIRIPGEFSRTDENKIKPPFIITQNDELYYSTYQPDGSVKFTPWVKGACSIAYGWMHGLYLTRDGEAYSFGSNKYGNNYYA